MRKIRKEKYKEFIKEKGKAPLITFVTLRFLVILCMILQIIRREYGNAILCVISLFLFTLPSLLEKKLKIKLPNALEITVYLFIYSAEILGEINHFYVSVPHFDTVLHTINGFICAAIGFSLVDLLNQKSKSVELSKVYLCLVAFCFSMTIGVVWELFEYTADKILLSDMQKDTIVNKISTVSLDETKQNKTIVIEDINKTILYDKDKNILTEIDGGYLDIGINDTMKDLFVNFVGASVFCLLGYIYLIERDKNNCKKKFIEGFIPQKSEN